MTSKMGQTFIWINWFHLKVILNNKGYSQYLRWWGFKLVFKMADMVFYIWKIYFVLLFSKVFLPVLVYQPGNPPLLNMCWCISYFYLYLYLYLNFCILFSQPFFAISCLPNRQICHYWICANAFYIYFCIWICHYWYIQNICLYIFRRFLLVPIWQQG